MLLGVTISGLDGINESVERGKEVFVDVFVKGKVFDGVGGILGALLTGVFTAPGLGGTGKAHFSIASQLLIQAEGVLITIVWSAVVAYVAYKIVDMVVGLRVTEEVEREGLDITSHGETAYNR